MSPKKEYKTVPFSNETVWQHFPFQDDPVFLRQLLSHIGDEFLIIDSGGKIIFANDAAVEGFGYSRKSILQKHVFDLLAQKISFRQWKEKYLEPLKRRGEPVSFRLERKSKSGVPRILDVTTVYVTYDNTGFILSMGRDVTRQIQLQRSLHGSKNLYRFLTEGAHEGIAAVEKSGQFIYANNALQEMIGLAQGEYRDRCFLEFVHPASHKKAKEIFAKAKKGIELIHEEIEARTTTGEIVPLELSVTPFIKGGEVATIHLIVRDLRPRQTMQQMKHQNEKMDALRYFIAGAAQELRNPLMWVTKRADGILKKYGQRDFEYISFQDFKDIFLNIETIRDQARYCFETSERLMAMGQKRNGILRHHCNLNRVVKEVLRDKKTHIHQHEVQVKAALTTGAAEVRMRAVDVMQVVHNLIDNAVQAMPSGGVLTVKTSFAPKEEGIALEIKDQGVGISEDHMPHILEPFFTTKVRGTNKNSGLGLPIVYSLIDAVQGKIQITSSLRKGTVVKVILPVYKSRNRR
ncbi:MAG: PAS domain S-box protein [Candidatus Omnitrophota bacterium]